VSAKHWNKGKVGIDEVQRLRGIKGDADTAIIVTTADCTADAIKESSPSQNQRSIILINGKMIIDTCLRRELGISPIKLSTLYRYTGFEKYDEI
jgi:hypothetical protein